MEAWGIYSQLTRITLPYTRGEGIAGWPRGYRRTRDGRPSTPLSSKRYRYETRGPGGPAEDGVRIAAAPRGDSPANGRRM